MKYEDILLLVDAYRDAHTRSEATISSLAVGHARAFERLRNGKGCTVKTFNRLIA